jgi:hypothetical protein
MKTPDQINEIKQQKEAKEFAEISIPDTEKGVYMTIEEIKEKFPNMDPELINRMQYANGPKKKISDLHLNTIPPGAVFEEQTTNKFRFNPIESANNLPPAEKPEE